MCVCVCVCVCAIAVAQQLPPCSSSSSGTGVKEEEVLKGEADTQWVRVCLQVGLGVRVWVGVEVRMQEGAGVSV